VSKNGQLSKENNKKKTPRRAVSTYIGITIFYPVTALIRAPGGVDEAYGEDFSFEPFSLPVHSAGILILCRFAFLELRFPYS